jgi:hypothetical protein
VSEAAPVVVEVRSSGDRYRYTLTPGAKPWEFTVTLQRHTPTGWGRSFEMSPERIAAAHWRKLVKAWKKSRA